MNIKDFKKIKLPEKPGVYFFHEGKKILYIGKATSLKDRVKSYFGKDLIETRGPMLLDMVTLSNTIKWQETDSVLEAVILEANLIKKYQPKYNTKEKDNKSFNYVCITNEKIPKVLIERGRVLFSQQHPNSSSFTPSVSYTDKNLDIVSKKDKYQAVFGPFPNGQQLREAMKIIRRIFPYVDEQSSKKNNMEFYKQLGLVPEINKTPHKNPFKKVLGSPRQILLEARPDHFEKEFSASLLEYKKNIKNLKLFFEGKKKSILTNLKKEMVAFAKRKEFEKANVIKKRIFALNHINDVALIKGDIAQENPFKKVLGSPRQILLEARPDHFEKHFLAPLIRVEAYDIAHMGGKNMVGVMVVMENGELVNSEYRKFIIRTQDKSNDIGALEEVLSRRFRHTEWGLPGIVVMDGGIAQINVAKSVLSRYQFKIPVVSVVKDDKHKAKAIMGDDLIIKKYKKEILLINNESHRFAIAFHKQKRNTNFLK